MSDDRIPPPPDGFVLDAPAAPSPPKGFVLDRPTPSTQAATSSVPGIPRPVVPDSIRAFDAARALAQPPDTGKQTSLIGDVGRGIAQAGLGAARTLGLAGAGAIEAATLGNAPTALTDPIFRGVDAIKGYQDTIQRPTSTGGRIAEAAGGLVGAIPTLGIGNLSEGQDIIHEGGSLGHALGQTALNAAGDIAGLGLGKIGEKAGVVKRALSQGAANTAFGEAARVAGNAIAPEERQREFDPLAAAINFGAGVGFGVLPHARETATPNEGAAPAKAAQDAGATAPTNDVGAQPAAAAPRAPRFPDAAPGSLADAANTIADTAEVARAPRNAEAAADVSAISDSSPVPGDSTRVPPLEEAPGSPRADADAQPVEPPAPGPSVPWFDAATGEMRAPTDVEVKDQFLRIFETASQGGASRSATAASRLLADEWGVPQARLKALRTEAIAERKDGITPENRSARAEQARAEQVASDDAGLAQLDSVLGVRTDESARGTDASPPKAEAATPSPKEDTSNDRAAPEPAVDTVRPVGADEAVPASGEGAIGDAVVEAPAPEISPDPSRTADESSVASTPASPAAEALAKKGSGAETSATADQGVAPPPPATPASTVREDGTPALAGQVKGERIPVAPEAVSKARNESSSQPISPTLQAGSRVAITRGAYAGKTGTIDRAGKVSHGIQLDNGTKVSISTKAVKPVSEQVARAEVPVVEAAARESAAHPEAETPATAAQQEAGNHKMGHVNLHGLDVTIEVPKGGLRRGTAKDGTPWERAASDHYGYIKRTESADGEQVDVYLGPHAEKPDAKVFVIDQVRPGTNVYDESKAMVGFDSGRAARASYEANFPKGLKTFGGIREMSMDEFKQWVRDGSAKKPATDQVVVPSAKISAREQRGAVESRHLLRERIIGGDRVDAAAVKAMYGEKPLGRTAALDALRELHGDPSITPDHLSDVPSSKVGKSQKYRPIDIVEAARSAHRAMRGKSAEFRQTAPGEPGLARAPEHHDAVARAVRDVTDRWGDNAPRVRVLDSADQLPASAKRAEPERYREAQGFYDGDTVYLVARNLKDREHALRTLAHESVGHYGVDRIVDEFAGRAGGGMDKLVADITRLRREGLGSADLRAVMNDVAKRYPRANERTFAREVIAVAAERNLRNGLVARAVAAVRAWARQHFPDIKFTESDLRSMLARSARYLEEGTSRAEQRASVQALAFDHAPPTDSSAFKRFFGASKVVDKAGQPMVVHHGTGEDFTVFDAKHAGAATEHATSPLGHFFTEDRRLAERYAENASEGRPADERVIDAYLSIRKPYEMTLEQAQAIETPEQARALRAKLAGEGYDGIRIAKAKTWIAFESGQAKSVENRGTFDRANPDINFSLPEPDEYREARTFDAARRAAAQNIVGKELVNDHGAVPATVSRRTLEKMLSQSAVAKSVSTSEHARAVANLDHLYRNGVVDQAHVDRNGEPTLAAIHRVVAPMVGENGDVLAVKMTVKETTSPKNPNPLYSMEAVDVAKPALVAPHKAGLSGNPSESRNSPQAGFSEHVTRMLEDFKARLKGGKNETVATDENVAGKQGQRAAGDESRREADHRMQHRPAGPEFGSRLDDLTQAFSDDIYSRNAATLHGHGVDAQADREAVSIIQRVKGNPDAEVTIYRAVPKDASDSINSGDWVSLTRNYARDHGESVLDGDFKIVSAKVPAATLFNEGNSIHEFGYHTNDTSAPGSSGDFSMPEAKPFQRPQANMDALGEVLADPPNRGVMERAKDWVRGKYEDFVPAMLGALQRRQLTELIDGQEGLKGYGKQYDERVQKLEADRNQLMTGAHDAAEHPNDMLKRGAATIAGDLRNFVFQKGVAGWLGRRNPEAQKLADVMHAATLKGLDPSEEYTRLMMSDSQGKYFPWTPQAVNERIKAIRGQMRGRPGDDKAAMMEEVKYLKNLAARERKRLKDWPDILAAYQALSPEAKALYRQMRDWHNQMRDATEQGLIARIEAVGRDMAATTGADLAKRYVAQTVQRIRAQFESNRLEGVYFPLDRNGDFWVSFKDSKGEQGFKMFETAGEAAAAEKKLKAAGFTVEAQGRRDGDYRAKNAPSGTFIADVIETLKKAGAPEKVQDEVYQTFLRTLPEMSMRKHSIHRKGTEGYDSDILRGFSKNAFHGAHQLARLRHAHELQSVVDAAQMGMDNYRNSGESNVLTAARGDALLGELKKRHDYIMAPKDAQLANVANSIGFLYYMGASPASAIVNMTQNAQVTLPALGAQFGWGKASRMLGAALRDSMRTGGNLDRTLTLPEERQAYNVLRARGDIDKTQSHSLAALAEGNQLQSHPAWSRVMTGLGWAFHKAEVINREAAGMAAFRLARSRGDSFHDAIQFASDTINGTHFDYSASNRPRLMQGNVGRIVGQFKNYSVGMTWMLYRNLYQAFKGESPEIRAVARRTLTGVLGMTGLMAGTMGLPIYNAMKYSAQAAHTLFGDDEPYDFDTEYRKWLGENLGEDAASMIADGVVNRAGANVGRRVGLSNLWFQDADRSLEGKDAYYQLLDSIAGPIGGIAKNLFVGSKMVGDGNVERGVETMLPKFAKDSMKALRFAHEGANTLRGDPILPDVSGPEAFIQALGFQPTRLFEQQEKNSALKNYEQEILDRRQTLMNAYAMAVRAGDDRDVAMSKIHAFNARYPEIAIKSDSLRQSLRARARYSAEQQGGITVNRKLAPRLREMVGQEAAAP